MRFALNSTIENHRSKLLANIILKTMVLFKWVLVCYFPQIALLKKFNSAAFIGCPTGVPQNVNEPQIQKLQCTHFVA